MIDFSVYLFYDHAKWMNMWINIVGPLNATQFTTYLDSDSVTVAINPHHCTQSIQVMMTCELEIAHTYSLFYSFHFRHPFLYTKLSIDF